jgi:hypothetical protein
MFKYEQKFDDLRKLIESTGLSVRVSTNWDRDREYYVVTVRENSPGKVQRFVDRWVPERKVRLSYSTAWFQSPNKPMYRALESAWKEWRIGR